MSDEMHNASDQVRQRVRRLEQDIKDLIRQLEGETGIGAGDMSVTVFETWGDGSRSCDVEITLDWGRA